MNNGQIERKKNKKLTFQAINKKIDLNNKAEKLKPEKGRWKSTKLVMNFVPQLRPKKSFCKPSFFLLDDQTDTKEESKKSDELNIINSCDEEEGFSDSSSDISCENEGEKINSIFKEESGQNYGRDIEPDSSIKKELGDSKEKDVNFKNNNLFNNDDKENGKDKEFKRKEKQENIIKLASKLDTNIIDDNHVRNRNIINEQKNDVDIYINNSITILDILSIKDQKNN